MIRITRPRRPPAILTRRGAQVSKALRDAYEADPGAYRSGAKTFSEDFDPGIYGAKSVKNALRKAQHDKCCFCESKVGHIAYGDVEHFRPKAGYRQAPDDPLGRPGYYWLAYEWSNLFFCCQLCNQRHKKNLFPLADPAQRARSHRDDVRGEKPLFIDPTETDPALQIGFREHYAYPAGGSPAGEATIEALGLNRPELVERRYDRYRTVLTLLQNRELLLRTVAKGNVDPEVLDQLGRIDAFFDEIARDSSEYAAMVRAALSSFAIP